MDDQPTLAIPLDIPDVRVLRTAQTNDHARIIEVESALTTAMCRRCGRTITEFHGYDQPIQLRHLPLLGSIVYIRLRPKRCRCPSCDDHPTTTQRWSWYVPKALHTTAYAHHLLMPLVKSTIEDVCQQDETSDDVVLGTIERWVATGIDGEALPPCTILGIDEIALKQGHRDYVVMVTARLPTGRLVVLAVLPDRTKATLVTWLTTLPVPHRRQIRTGCTDMWAAYVTAVREILRHATIVIDRFPVAKHDRDGADTLRKQECKRLRAELPHETMDQLKPTMWPFRKRPANRDAEEQGRLTRLFEHTPQLKQAYDRREQLTTIFDMARAKAEGRRRIHRWQQAVDTSGLTCFAPFLKLLDTWVDPLANDFRQRQTSGFVEGLNNKLKGLKRRCFGIYNLRHLFQRITLALDGDRRFSPWQEAPH
ncbi:MAG: ISL3 family transposase [Actinomycetota bacterium]|nr:ISL3 family transposase [Actinomycetota bacterium]